jgi:hypothetical protein
VHARLLLLTTGARVTASTWVDAPPPQPTEDLIARDAGTSVFDDIDIYRKRRVIMALIVTPRADRVFYIGDARRDDE